MREKGGLGGAHGGKEDAYVTCSLSLLQYMHSSHHSQHGVGSPGGAVHAASVAHMTPTAVTYLLMVLYWRRMMECREQKVGRFVG